MASSDSSPAKFYGLSLHVSVKVLPENVDKFLGYLKPVYELVAAEPECTFFEVFVSAEEPGLITWVEGWNRDKKWLQEVQLQKEYYKEYFANTFPLFIRPSMFLIDFLFYFFLGRS